MSYAQGLTACTMSTAVIPPPLPERMLVSRSWLPFSSSTFGVPCRAAIASLPPDGNTARANSDNAADMRAPVHDWQQLVCSWCAVFSPLPQSTPAHPTPFSTSGGQMDVYREPIAKTTPSAAPTSVSTVGLGSGNTSCSCDHRRLEHHCSLLCSQSWPDGKQLWSCSQLGSSVTSGIITAALMASSC